MTATDQENKRIRETVAEYIRGVDAGTIIAGVLVVRAVRRHLWDLEHRDDLRHTFDDEAACRVIRFFGLLRHWKGEWAGKPFTLSPWQMFLLWVLFGWKRKDGTRRFRVGYIKVGRKNGKTPMLAGIGLYMMTADGEAGAEIYSAATKKDQARIIVKDAAMLSKTSPALRKRLVVSPALTGRNASGNFVSNIAYPAGASKMEVLSKESDTQDGLSPSAGLVDELHAHKDRGIWDVLDSGTSSRRQPLMLAITTAGEENDESIDAQTHEIAEKVLEGFDKPDGVKDETFFAFVAMASKEDDPYDEKTWIKANPNYGISVKPDDLRRKAEQAKQFAGFRPEFFRKHLNLRTQAASAWINLQQWDQCRTPFELSDVEGWECAAGMDLAAKNDLTALVLMFQKNGRYRLKSWYWMPEETAKERRRRSPFWGPWIDEGFIAVTPGPVNDFDFLEGQIVELGQDAKFLNILFDPHNCIQTAVHLRDNHGFAVTEFTQTYTNYNEPCKEFERLIVGGLLEHDGNPVTRFMVGNMTLETNSIGLMKPVKPKPNSEKKIDGGQASIMALGHWVRGETEDGGELADIPFVVAKA
jgi:phage terminase large subunit-like protein